MAQDPQLTSTTKTGAAAVSIASNTALILLKVVAGMVTGSVALLTEALHSLIDLIASVVAFFSVRKADEPADAEHPYGHEKIENMAAAIEGMLILVGSGIIVLEAVRRLVQGGETEHLGYGVGVIGLSIAANLGVSGWLFKKAAETGSPALHADAEHLRTDMISSVGVFIGLSLVMITDAQWLDPVVAILVAAWISRAGLLILLDASKVLVDETLPQAELDVICDEVNASYDQGIRGFHALRARQAGARRYIDMHVQFAEGTTLEDAHRASHELQDAISMRLGGADVLIHLEPEDRVRPGYEVPRPGEISPG